MSSQGLRPRSLRDFALSLVLLAFFIFSFAGQIFAGFKTHNNELRDHNQAPLSSVMAYLGTGHFVSSTAENMESEFLQMAVFVLLTKALYQRGSAESKKPPDQITEEDAQEEREEAQYCKRMKKKWGLLWTLYENSLTTVLVFMFFVFFALHACGSLAMINEQNLLEHKPLIHGFEVLATSDFWFESFQNWQSEFFSIVCLGALSIFLRQKGSPQSKRMNDALWETKE